MDLWIEPTPENAARLMAALGDFGFGSLGLQGSDLTAVGKIVQLGVVPNRIDLLTTIDGVSFREAWDNRVGGTYGTQSVCYIGKDELIRNKRASGRLQDLADASLLEGD